MTSSIEMCSISRVHITPSVFDYGFCQYITHASTNEFHCDIMMLGNHCSARFRALETFDSSESWYQQYLKYCPPPNFPGLLFLIFLSKLLVTSLISRNSLIALHYDVFIQWNVLLLMEMAIYIDLSPKLSKYYWWFICSKKKQLELFQMNCE